MHMAQMFAKPCRPGRNMVYASPTAPAPYWPARGGYDPACRARLIDLDLGCKTELIRKEPP
jgi:hypothetical protein